MIRVQEAPFDCGLELNSFAAGRRCSGAVASFIGLVRDMASNAAIDAMTLEHYPVMTEKQLALIEDEARRRWRLHDCLIIHRYGRLTPGEPIVMVLTASAHRAEAMQSCEFLIDWLKTKAPFWKMEERAGETRWVESKESDDAAASRWNEQTSCQS